MSGRLLFSALGLFVGLLGAGLSLAAATPTEKSRASLKLLEAYGRDDPAVVAKAARPLAEKGNAEARFVLGLLLDIGAGVRIDHVAGLDWLQKAAEQGHVAACLCLAWKYETGFGLMKAEPETAQAWRLKAGTPGPETEAYAAWFSVQDGKWQPDLGRAFLWMLDQAEAGNTAAIGNLAEVHLFTFWTQPDAVQHLQWVQRMVDAGDMAGVEQLSLYYTVGLFVPADPVKGLEFRRRAAEGGRPAAQTLLGQQYETGDGVERDLKTALLWLEKAARQNHAPALQHLIDLRRNGRPGLTPDFKEAVRLAEQGWKLGDAACTRNLADLYNRGDGVKQDVKKSAKLYREAADKGEMYAMTMLGWISAKGQIGTPDFAEARRWYGKAAAQGHVRAMRELGEMAEAGQGGPVDLAAAFAWYEKAARTGEAYSQEKLGDMLLNGRGVAVDAEEAVNWFRLAAANTAANNLVPKLRHWPITKLELAVDGLIAVARETNDPWLQDNLVAALVEQGLKLTREGLEKKILLLLEEPDLLRCPGILPEACLAVLEAHPEDEVMRRRAAEWLARLQAADRLQSALLLGRHALLGLNMPCDIPRALQWAKIAAANTPWKGSLLLAQIESATAEEPERRATSWATVRKFAAAGDPEAALLVMDRYVGGLGDLEDRTLVVGLREHALRFARLSGQAELATRLEHDLAKVSGVPTEEELTKKAAAILGARQPGGDATPAVLYRPPPHYPYALRVAKVRGRVKVEFIINTDGRVIQSRVQQSDHPLFSASALTAINQWRFVPGWKNGRMVNVRADQLLEFDPN